VAAHLRVFYTEASVAWTVAEQHARVHSHKLIHSTVADRMHRNLSVNSEQPGRDVSHSLPGNRRVNGRGT
jgi:hypothetical protein